MRALTCPQCGGTIALRVAGVSVSLVCEHCGSTLDATRDDVKLIAAAATAMHRPPIALGTRGTLGGVQWEVVGYVERADGWTQWCEYLLFNPYEGYAFLVDDGRRFSLGRLLDRSPGEAWNGVTLGPDRYRRYGTSYDAWVTFVVGEFYWRVSVGETVRATDYVTPGAMISCEENGAERTWTLLKMLDRGVAERAFGVPPRPRQTGGTPSPHEPSPYRRLLQEAWIILIAAFIVLMVIAFSHAGRERVLGDEIAAPFGAAPRSKVIGSITLPAPYNRVTIGAQALSIDNAWVDLDYSLVNRATQASIDSYATAEHYSGTDSEGHWSEGDRSPSVTLASVPAGTYDLLVEARAERWTGAVRNDFWNTPPSWSGAETAAVTITVHVGGMFAGNVVLALLLMAIWPVVLICLHFGFEKRRMAPVAEDA